MLEFNMQLGGRKTAARLPVCIIPQGASVSPMRENWLLEEWPVPIGGVHVMQAVIPQEVNRKLKECHVWLQVSKMAIWKVFFF